MISKYINNNKKIINDLKNDIKLDNLFLNEYNNYINLGKKNDLINKLNLNINLQQGGAASNFNKDDFNKIKNALLIGLEYDITYLFNNVSNDLNEFIIKINELIYDESTDNLTIIYKLITDIMNNYIIIFTNQSLKDLNSYKYYYDKSITIDEKNKDLYNEDLYNELFNIKSINKSINKLIIFDNIKYTRDSQTF